MISRKSPVLFNAPKNDELEPDPEKHSIASTIVSASIIKRRSEQSINFNSILWLFAGIMLFVFWGWALNNTNSRAAKQAVARQTQMAQLRDGTYLTPGTGLNSVYIVIDPDYKTPTPTKTPIPTISNDQMKTPGVLATYASIVFWSTVEAGYTPTPTTTNTPDITQSPVPTETPKGYSINFVFKYSYYNPKLGGVNCFEWNNELQDCMSTLANGEDWRDKYGKVVACPPDIALGTIVEVTYPDALKGYWICKDRGSAIVNNWIDFLDIKQRAEWGESVSAVLYPPTVPMEQISNGTH